MNGINGSDISALAGYRFSSRQLRRSSHRRLAAALRRADQGLSSEPLEPRTLMAVTPSISIDDVTVVEGDSGTKNAAVLLRLSQAATMPVSVRVATANGTATAGVDYLAKTGLVSFATGATTTQVLIAIKGDRTFEPDETFTITLSAAQGGDDRRFQWRRHDRQQRQVADGSHSGADDHHDDHHAERRLHRDGHAAHDTVRSGHIRGHE